MVVTCEIQFENNPQGIYYAGQVLTGKITLTADKVKQVKAVSLKIHGFAHTSWSENKSNNNNNNNTSNNTRTHYHGHVDYVNSLTNLLSPKVSDEPVLIEPGIHTFSFACHIPNNCPSSFEGCNGHIRYVVKIKLIRPWKFDVDFSRGFTVLKVMNLNYDSPLLKCFDDSGRNIKTKFELHGILYKLFFKMVVTCLIEFEKNPEGSFCAGQIVTGKIRLTADKVKTVKGISFKINGLAHTEWTESGDSNSSDTTYIGNVNYIKVKTYLLTPSAGADNVAIECGEHCFRFRCHIPSNCPSSVEGYNGYIRYWIQVDLKRPWKNDQIYTRGFTVVNIVNLNYESSVLKMPMNTEIQKVFCCGPFKSDPLQIHIQLPQSGYVPGQLIPVSVLVTNDTKAPIDEICLRLVMMVCLYSTHPYQRSKTETMTIAKLKGDPVLQHCKKHFNYLLPIPATPPTCFNLCTIIQIAYRVEVEAKMNGIMYANQCIHTPVTIGNVPLQMDGVVVQQQPISRQFNPDYGSETEGGVAMLAMLETSVPDNNNGSCDSQRNHEPWSAYGITDAPVYAEASHMPQGKLSEDSAHDYGEKNFSPKYPVFNVPSPTAELPISFDDTDGHIAPNFGTDPNKTTWL